MTLTKAQAMAVEKMKNPKIAALKKQLRDSLRKGKSDATVEARRSDSK